MSLNVCGKQSVIALLSLLLVCAGLSRAADDEKQKPNFVFVLVDDMGWTDVSCFGSKFYETPNIDKLAAQGMKFTQAYSNCTVCSPSRASILTGKYCARLHITDWIPGHVRPQAKLSVPDWTMYLPLEEMNLARRLKMAGYATASIGKWHLGGPTYYPDKQGFDINFGGTDRGQPPTYFAPYKISTIPDGPVGEFLSDRLTAEAVKFIESNKDHPFFLYLPHFAVHQPIAGKKSVIEKFKAKVDPTNPQHSPVYAALVESVDDSVGQIMQKLDELKLSDHTIIVFTSDNGGLLPVTNNLPLRAGKGSAYEGGVRVPMIVRWPGVTKAGSECTTPVMGMDFYPTFLEIAGLSDDAVHAADGESLVPLLRQSGPLKRTSIYWHYPHYHPGGATPYSAVRDGDFKLILFYETGNTKLFNLKDDIGETKDLAPQQPDVVARLRQNLETWRQSVGAQLPTANPKYDPKKEAQHLKRDEN